MSLEKPTSDNPELASLQIVLQLLEATAQKFRELKTEADQALQEHRDTANYKEKLTERATLILNLPENLADALVNLDEVIRKHIEREIDNIVYLAQERMKSGKRLSLDGLIDSFGYEKNALEELINNIKTGEI